MCKAPRQTHAATKFEFKFTLDMDLYVRPYYRQGFCPSRDHLTLNFFSTKSQ